ncbi:MAG: PTS sugar transporter subunit IIA [Marinomonas sp.]
MNVNFKLLPEAAVTTRLATKQAVLEQAAQVFAQVYGLDASAALEGLQERERLGSTGFGRGVAIPHARAAGINRPIVVLLQLETPVDFDAADGMPVDLVFAMLSPENAGATHLHALAAISRLVRDDAMHEALSQAPDAEALYAQLSNRLYQDAA